MASFIEDFSSLCYMVSETATEAARKLPRNVDTREVGLSGRILCRGGSNEEVAVYGEAYCRGVEAG